MKRSFALLLSVTPAFAFPEGYELSNWAEPFNIEYPTAITAAADGTIYVSVDRNGSVGKGKNMGKVVSCRDTNGDGKADRFIDFVPNVDSPRGGHFVRDTLYLIHPPFLSAFRDTTGDGVADEQKVLLENIGFGLRHPRGSDHTTNGCRMGIDGWIYISVGDVGLEGTKGTDGKVVTLRGGGVARVRPDGTDLEVYSYHTRNICDVAISPRMDLFTRDNTNDGKGWNIRVHHLTNGSEHGYPRLYKNFADETLKPMLDLGGGSGTGALYLTEPGHEEMLLTCDWTTGKIYREALTPKGASFSVKESVFMDLTRAVDIDVDGEGNLYLCDWRNGRFRFAGEGVKIGMIQKLIKKGLKAEPFPDLRKMKLEALLEQLRSPSAVRRLEASREILTRDHREVMKSLITSFSTTPPTLETRIASGFILAQIDGLPPGTLLEFFGKEKDGMPSEYAVRAAADLKGKMSDASLRLVMKALRSGGARLQNQAIVALMRISNPPQEATAEIMKVALAAKDPRITNTALRALVTLADTDTLLAQSDKRLARLALMRIHKPAVVSGVSAQLEQTSGEARMNLIKVLARLYHREEKWDLKAWWGTRPDDRGPYFAPVPWEETANITGALEGVFEKLGQAEQPVMLSILGKNRVPVSQLKLGEQDPLTLALVTPTPDPSQIALLTEVAKDSKRPWPQRLKSYRSLTRLEWRTVRNQVEVLASWIDQKLKQEDLDRELGDFVNQPTLIMSINPLRELAKKGSQSESRVSWRSLLTLIHSPLVKEKWKTKIRETIKENPREEGFYLALSDLMLPGYEQQIESAIDSDNDTLIEAAKHAKKVIAEATASKGKQLARMKPGKVMEIALVSQGDAALGEKLYTRQGCIACHAVDQKAVQKGPYLGSAGSKFTKDYLIQSILDPNAVVAQGFQTELITMKDQSAHLGFVTREEDGVIDLRNIAGLVTKLKVSEVKKRDHQDQSMMPVGLASTLTMEEFNHLIAYLSSMKE